MDLTLPASGVPASIPKGLEQIAMELAFVSPGEDEGLLPINSILLDLDDASAHDAPPTVRTAIDAARSWIDAILDGSGTFTAENVAKFSAWHAFMMRAVAAWGRGTELPEPPSSWSADASESPSGTATAASETTATPPEQAIVLNLKDDADLLQDFYVESLELLGDIERGVLVLEENPADADTINSIFRAFHTFKGGAGFLHLHALQELAHDLESLLDAARQAKLAISSPIIDIILAGSDALKLYTDAIGHQIRGGDAGQPIFVPTSQLITRVRAVLRGDPLPEATAAARAPEPASPREAATELSPRAGTSLATPDPLATKVVRTNEASVVESSGFVKLETWKLDALVDLVGELVIAQSMVVQDPAVRKLEGGTLERSLRQLGRTTSELQRNTMSLRMMPVRGVFQKMLRLVRDVSAQVGKQIHLKLDGEDTELDRNIVEKLGDPLVHMIRNAIDHGIEPPEERLAAGKPASGTIRLSASHHRGGFLIRIEDDGRGLNAPKLLAKAKERGLVASGTELSESQIFGLIFMPGFSTAAVVTELSGRGVGMDVVKRNIEDLHGRVEVQSVLGAGTTFNIVLPLTLAIIEGLIVGVGDQRYIIPTTSVRESFRPQPGTITAIQQRGAVVTVRGKQTPVLPLGPFLGVPTKGRKAEDGIMVVVESGDASRAIFVDELIGKQEVVIKSLGSTFVRQNIVAAGAVLGDGTVGLILDVDTLVNL